MAGYDLGTARGEIVIDADGAEAGVAKAEHAVSGLDKSAKAAAPGLAIVGTALIGISGAAVAGFGAAVNAAANFDEQLSELKAVSGTSAEGMEAIRQKALQLGADTKFSASEAALAMTELAKAGLNTDDILGGAADAAVALAAAGGIELPEAATIASNAMNQFGLSAQEMPRIADLISGAANASAIDVSDFGLSLQQSGAVANTVGLKFDDLSVAIAAMGNAGIKGSDAGTSLKTMLMNLQPQTKKQTTLMKDLGLITEDGSNQFFTAEGKVKSLAQISGTLQNALKGQTDQQKLSTLETLFGSDAIRAAAVIAKEGESGINDLAAAMGKVTAADVAAERMNNLKGSIEQLKGSFETALIIIGERFQPIIRAVVDVMTTLVNKFSEFSPQTQTMILAGVGLVAALAGIAGIVALVTAAWATMGGVLAATAITMATIVLPITLAIAALIALAFYLKHLWETSETFRTIVTNAVKAVTDFFQNKVMPIIEKVMTFIIGEMQEVYDWAMEIWPNIQEAISHAINFIREIIERVVAVILFIWRAWGDDLLNIVMAAWDFIRRIISNALDFVMNIINTVVHIINGDWGAAWRSIKDAFAAVWDSIKAIVTFGVDVIKSLLGGLLSTVGQIFSNVGGWLFDAGRALIQGLIEGIKAVAGKVVDEILNPVKDGINKVKDFLHIGSPSKLMMDIGSDTMEGMIQGLQQMRGQLASVARDSMAVSVANGAPGAAAPLGMAGQTFNFGGIHQEISGLDETAALAATRRALRTMQLSWQYEGAYATG